MDSNAIPKPEPGPGQPWNMSLRNSIMNDKELDLTEVVPRPLLIDPWCREGDLGFIFAARGLGKTWLGMHLAHCLASFKDFGPWKVSQTSSKILYMDGEMALADIKYRNHVLGGGDNLWYLNHEVLYERSGRIIDLSDKELQDAVLEFCKQYPFNVLILDNLSCLVSKIDENSPIDWEKILPWLLNLRRNHITVIFIHHAGRSDQYMRGHSKREDPAAWIIHLKHPHNDPDYEVHGAHFISSFEKYRNAPERPIDLEWNFSPINNGQDILVRFEQCNPLDIFIEIVAQGVHQCKDIAEEMGLSHVAVSRLAHKADAKSLIEIKKGKYYVKSSGPKSYNPSDDANDD
jgi:RecA-family ATPase